MPAKVNGIDRGGKCSTLSPAKVPKAPVRRVAVSTALALGIFGCGAQRVEPAPTAPTAQAPAPRVPAPIAQTPAPVESVPTTNEAPRREPPPPLPLVGIERWRTAIEGYVPAVRLDNQLRLEGAIRPFAQYLNQVHARIHPIFADQFLASLDGLPSSDPMNQPDLHVTLEIILESKEGRIQRMGATAVSGVTAFDVMALDSVYRAQPFGPPPQAIVSPDGFVYFHWEFHRGPEACGTWNTRPFLLGSASKTAQATR